MAISVTITNAKGYQLASAAGRGNLKSNETLLRTLVEQDNNLQSAMNQSFPQFAASNVTGTNTKMTITVGFQPKSVFVQEVTGKADQWFWSQGMSNGTAWAVHTSTNGTVWGSKLQFSSGILVTSTGFQIGRQISINTKSLYYEAIRSA